MRRHTLAVRAGGPLLAAGLAVTAVAVPAEASPQTVRSTASAAAPAWAAPAAAAVAPRAGDVTRTRAARVSRAHRASIGFGLWSRAPYTRMVARRESRGNCRVVNWRGPWRGKWQMTDHLWRAFGGRAFAVHPERASCSQQDLVAYRIWIAQGWRPWGG